MNVFVDECVNKKLMPHLTGHRFVHATDTPLRELEGSERMMVAKRATGLC